MSRRPNFAFAATQALSGGSYPGDGNSNGGGYKPAVFAKPFDGFKTTNITGNYNPKPLDSHPQNKFGGTAPYAGGGISVSAIEKNLKKDIEDLDWELEATKKYATVSKTSDHDASFKPRLFQKKHAGHEKPELNNTGETRATATNTVAASDWDLPDHLGTRPSAKAAVTGAIKPPKKSATTAKVIEQSVANDWDLGDSVPKGNTNNISGQPSKPITTAKTKYVIP